MENIMLVLLAVALIGFFMPCVGMWLDEIWWE